MMNKQCYQTAQTGMWQLFDGENWRHAFSTLELAENYAHKFRATAIGRVDERGVHCPIMQIERRE